MSCLDGGLKFRRPVAIPTQDATHLHLLIGGGWAQISPTSAQRAGLGGDECQSGL
jgi:hypothetical protein